MSFPRLVATFNIKDPEVQAIYNEITNESRGLLSEICCNALKAWKGHNLNATELEQKLLDVERQKEELKQKEDSYTKRLSHLQATQVRINAKNMLPPEKRLESIRSAKGWIMTCYQLADEIIEQLAIEWIDNKDEITISSKGKIITIFDFVASKGYKAKNQT